MLEDKISSRCQSLVSPASMAMAQRGRSLRQAGVEIADFSLGEPDFDTPQHIKEAAWQALRDGYTHYTPSRGYPALLEAIAASLHATHTVEVEPQRQIIVTPGAKQAILITLLALLNEGDEVLAPMPCWLSYASMVQLAGGRMIPVPTDEGQGFVPDAATLERYITPRTKAIILNTPCNPTGVLWSEAQLERIGVVAARHDLVVISDETYSRLVYDGRAFVSPATCDGMAERTVVIDSFSKSHAMTGWRIGYLAGPSALVDAAARVHEHSATCVAAFVQRAALAALEGPQDCVTAMVKEYQARRDLMVDGINQIPRLHCTPVAGAFYAFMCIQELGMTSVQAAEFLLERAGVITTPGAAYGESGEGYLRLSFATTTAIIQQGLAGLRRAVCT